LTKQLAAKSQNDKAIKTSTSNALKDDKMIDSGLKKSTNNFIREDTPPKLTNIFAWGANCKINFKTSNALH
jgi:hypothetical protein